MDFHEISRTCQQIWETKPSAVVLLTIGFVVFLFLVIDTWRHKRRRKRPR